MDILMLSWEYPPRVIGGVAPHVRNLARALVERGERVTVITAPHPGLDPVTDDAGVEVRRVTASLPCPPDFPGEVLQFNLGLVEEALQLAAAGRSFDVIHCHDWLVAPAGRVLKHAWRRPLVATIHATEYGRNGGLHNPLQHYINGVEWWLGYEAWRVITCSRYMSEEVCRVFQLPRDKVEIVPNGVHRWEFQLPAGPLEEIRRLRAPGGLLHHPILVFMGRLVWEKGVQDLIEAMPLIRARFPQARLIVAGEGPMKDQLTGRVSELGLHDAVYFAGFVAGTNRNRLLALADVAVFPSRYEPFGIVCLEAMAAGVPVVVGDTGGMAEVVRHGENGLRVPPASPEAIAGAVCWLLEAPDFAARLARQALRDIERKYDWSSIAHRTRDVYRRVLKEYARSEWRPAADRHPPVEEPVRSLSLRVMTPMREPASRYRLTGQASGLGEPSPAG